jgi:hypothetical protein
MKSGLLGCSPADGFNRHDCGVVYVLGCGLDICLVAWMGLIVFEGSIRLEENPSEAERGGVCYIFCATHRPITHVVITWD